MRAPVHISRKNRPGQPEQPEPDLLTNPKPAENQQGSMGLGSSSASSGARKGQARMLSLAPVHPSLKRDLSCVESRSAWGRVRPRPPSRAALHGSGLSAGEVDPAQRNRATGRSEGPIPPQRNQIRGRVQSAFLRPRRFGASPVTFDPASVAFAASLAAPFRFWPSPIVRASSERLAE